jgi:hypothetical protein
MEEGAERGHIDAFLGLGKPLLGFRDEPGFSR